MSPGGSRPEPLLFLIANFRPVVGGAETQAEGLARALAAAGQPVEILTAAVPGAPRREEYDGVVVRRALRIVRRRYLWGASHALGTAAFLAARGRRYRALVGFGLHAFHNPAALSWGALRRRPVLLRCECSGEFGDLATLAAMRAGGWVRATIDRAPAVIALTPGMSAELSAAGISAGRVVVVPNGVDLGAFSPPAAGVRRGGDLVFVGRLTDQKGVVDLLEGFVLLARSRADTRLRLLGTGPLEARLRERAAAAGLADRVSFAGAVPQEAVRAVLAGAAAVLHPSRGEGLSCLLLEAMATGCPIVASDLPANRELIRDGEEGLLVPPGDPGALAVAAVRLLEDGELAARLGAAAHRRAAAEFSLDSVARRYLGIISRIEERGAL